MPVTNAINIEESVNRAAFGSTKKAHKRGINIYSTSQLIGVSGRAKDGSTLTGQVETPLLGLTIDERLGIFRKVDIIFGVITSRMNRISALDYVVVPDTEIEDKIVEKLRTFKSVFEEFEDVEDLKFKVARQRMLQSIKETLPDVLPDLSNFAGALTRWRRHAKMHKKTSSSEVEDWLARPNNQVEWDSFIKQYVFDLLIHGAVGIYKEDNPNDGRVENLYILPGGTIFPFRSEHIGTVNAFVQTAVGIEPQIFYADEISYDSYAITSAWSYGIVPLDSLVNKIAESLLFDQLMAMQADGSKPPEKMIVFGEPNPFGDMADDISLPLDPDEQQRIETVMNEAKQGAIKTMTGYGTPIVLDLTRENTMSIQIERQREIRKSVAIVFNMSNMEINEAGAEGTSGRATSESQERIEKAKGTFPIIRSIQNKINSEILPFRFGHGFNLELQSEIDEAEQLNLWADKLKSGLFTANEIRTQDMNLDPFKGDEFDTPVVTQPPKEPIDVRPTEGF